MTEYFEYKTFELKTIETNLTLNCSVVEILRLIKE